MVAILGIVTILVKISLLAVAHAGCRLHELPKFRGCFLLIKGFEGQGCSDFASEFAGDESPWLQAFVSARTSSLECSDRSFSAITVSSYVHSAICYRNLSARCVTLFSPSLQHILTEKVLNAK